jgi:lipopolysaccharide biosynthesis regulator YciM
VRKGFAAFAALLVICGAAFAAPKHGREVRDLHYGDVLFYYYQDDFFEAITRLMAARAMGRAEAHSDDGDLLMGGMLLSYGQHRQATEIFQRLLDTTASPEVRDRAWFYLARVSYERGLFDQAEAALNHIKDTLPPRMDAERVMLKAQVLMEQDHFDEAAAVLGKWRGPPDWVSYAHYNLGVALVRSQHFHDGFTYLQLAGNSAGTDPEHIALRDRANVALGFAEIQSGSAEDARTALGRVRLDGPYSNKALLGLGWADLALNHEKEALTPWLELNTRDPLDIAVDESLLAVPYAMARLHSYGLAANHYQQAIKAYDDETRRLDASIAKIRNGQLVPALLADDPIDRMGWGWHLKKLPTNDESRYLLDLIASHPFQEALKNYRDLRYLHANLQKWSRDIGTFSDMLAAQQQRLDQRQPAVADALRHVDLDAIAQKRDALAARLDQIEDRQDAVALASDKERQQWASMQSIGERIGRLGDTEQAAALRDQLRLVKGVLLWNLQHDYRLRLWQQKHSLAELNQKIDEANSLRRSVDDAQTTARARIASLGERVAQQPPRIVALTAQTENLLARQQAELERMAIEELEHDKQRLNSYTLDAEFALAQIYDRAASQTPPTPAASSSETHTAPAATEAPP